MRIGGHETVDVPVMQSFDSGQACEICPNKQRVIEGIEGRQSVEGVLRVAS